MSDGDASRLLLKLQSAEDEGDVKALLTTDVLGRMALEMAQQQAMAGPVRHLSHGTRLFQVPTGWASQVIAGQDGVSFSRTEAELVAAMGGATGSVIFIPADADISAEKIAEISRRYGVIKTIFQEEGMK